jgi:hypothetical protein
MQKKVLYVDADSSPGHIPFNLGYIAKLNETPGVTLSVIFREGYLSAAAVSPAVIVRELPHRLYPKRNRGKLINRIFMLLRYRRLSQTIGRAKYDRVIFAAYDEFALRFACIRRPLLLVNHDNVRGLDNPVKRFFLRQISKRHAHIVFEEYMADKMRRHGIHNLFVVRHGLRAPFAPAPLGALEAIHKRFAAKDFARILLCPSFSSSDMQLVQELVRSKPFGELLAKHKILLVVRELRRALREEGQPNILTLNTTLATHEYEALFRNSFAILLPYPDTFRYRVSNMLHECISNGKLCFAASIPALKAFAPYMLYPYFYATLGELAACIDDAIAKKADEQPVKYRNTDALQPDFSKILTTPLPTC